MRHKFSEGRRNGSSTSAPLLLPDVVAAGKPSPLEDDFLNHEAAVERELAKSQADGKEANDIELDSDGNREEEEEEEEEEEGEDDEAGDLASDEQNVDATSEEDRAKLAEGFFEVEHIRRKRIHKGEAQYFIKWRGWPESANTWEPLEHLQSCPDIVEAFEQSLQSGKKTRKRKRKFTQPKRKMHPSHASSGSRDVKKPRLGRKTGGRPLLQDPSCALENNETNAVGGENDVQKITVHLKQAAESDGNLVNSGFKVHNAEQSQVNHRTGARRRKSGSVQRFKPDTFSTDPSHAVNSLPINGSYDSAELLDVGNTDAKPNIKLDFSRETLMITRILKPMGYSTSKSSNGEDVSVSFVAMRSDGKEVMVDNKFLKAYYPQVLIDFYEQHLCYNPTS